MNSLDLTKKNPPKTWWGPILVTVALFFGVALVVGLVFLTLFSLFAPQGAQALSNLYSFIGILIAVVFINCKIDKRPIEALGFHKKDWLKQYVYGIVWGLGMLAFVVGISMAFGVVKLNVNPEVNWLMILLTMGGFMIQGMTEEVLTRGYLQNNLGAKKGFWFAMIVQAVVFTAIHAANPGMTFMPVLNLFVVAIMFGMLFWYTDNMWVVGGMHFAWNFVLGPVIGIEVSGNVLPSTIMQANVAGAEIFTGGAFGIEASILTTIFAVVSSAILYVLIQKKKRVN